MTEKRQAYEIFKRAADLSETELEDFLGQACGESVGLRKQVDELLAMETEAEDFLPEEASATPVDVAELLTSSDQQLERNVGPYKLRQEIGEGGFGVVYLATQQEPMRRDVALKIIKPGMDSREVIARFEVERQALALMDHPNIARVFDAGQTDSGRPYFVMELVKGMPITEFCDKHNLNTNERLKLFISVCDAVQHAHQKGVIHRDLKPSNILVTLDGVPAAKVIDFGVAKSISQRFTEKTLFTQMGQMIGTPQYMSPEQAEMSGLDVDTRSDIYSLGVVLYELLTGTTPLDAERLRTAGYREMQQIIQEEEPPTPSTRVSKLGQDSTIASRRGLTDARRLRNTIKGDLDWIVMRALEKRRDRRYETANGLAADLERYLNDEPIVARPPSFTYRFQKALSRNKTAFATTAVVAMALIACSVISSWQTVVARRAQENEETQRLKAEAAEKQVEASLYTSLLGQIRATRNARQVGYREDVFALIRQALAMDTPQKNLSDLRDEAVSCMGDFSGFRPKQIVTGGGPKILMKLSPDDRWLARFNADGIEVRELRDIDSESPSAREVDRWKFEIQATWNSSLTFNRSGDRLLARNGHEFMELRLTRAGEWQQRGPSSIPNAIGTLAMDNSILAVVGDSSRLHLFDPETGQKRDSFDVPLGPATGIRRFAFTPDSQKLAIVKNNNTLIELWDVKQGRLLRASSPERPIGQTLAFNEDGRYLSALTGTGMRVYDTETDTEELRKVGEYNAASPNGSRDVQAFLPGHSVLASPSSTRRGVVIRDFLRKENLYVLEEKSEVRRALFSAEGDFLLTQSGDGVKLYSLRRAKERLVLPGHPSNVNGIAFSPDGSRLASISADHTIRTWDADSGKRVWKGELVGEGGNALAFSPDGRLRRLDLWENAMRPVRSWRRGVGRRVSTWCQGKSAPRR